MQEGNFPARPPFAPHGGKRASFEGEARPPVTKRGLFAFFCVLATVYKMTTEPRAPTPPRICRPPARKRGKHPTPC